MSQNKLPLNYEVAYPVEPVGFEPGHPGLECLPPTQVAHLMLNGLLAKDLCLQAQHFIGKIIFQCQSVFAISIVLPISVSLKILLFFNKLIVEILTIV